ncbi:glutathionylspermidine synthase family protein [Streptomyces stelliscabiei]|uniref:Glutathionylspermidine synthase n=1 Tax=Streptomyces stelliscabiei TaxID=146820 RepID=A0A8I0PBC9_9ACTN|nr:glutathionylspermidine synthase family protein [Streptomyces stelliscabiei]KND34656.1 glutathionylspermidine synthase [Streptomyces stelliscabiei]MBE1599536.1 glutathionylspermidine synthase [Streptomyces stelliscabiei]MDX2519551.1 glutathionylspermidine synthase family protein [Streptomyces stelliscabiei]MDX2553889.1 glutathionylspermidine synthase family protein [Streptomyces stelliscabiei]MDX2612632.1 glutathionylspermidine synthase family protein [Streptomyces stelliscabiei]
MERRTIEPRPGWQETVEEQGLIYPLTRYPDGSLRPYWDESAYYVFSLPEVEALEEVVEELHAMCLAAAAHIVEHDRFADLGITDPRLAGLVAEAWRRRAELPSVYGRFDLRHDGTGPVKLLEYNADTPTSLVEAAGPQWFWMEERFPGADQWNSLHERLVAAWKKQASLLPPGSPLYFAHSAGDELGEDLMTVAYLKETAEQAGLDTDWISMEDIGWDRLADRFVDKKLRFIRSIFKLYPWEWLTTDRFAPHVLATLDNGGGTGTTMWIEPAWKMLLSNKALLAVLWELYPGHPNLLPAYLDGPRELATTTGYVAKPLLGREGAGVTVHEAGATPVLSEEPCCYQELAPLPAFDGNHVVLGAWVVEDESAGLGIRESSGLVTDEYARFLPHVIL